MFINRSNPKQKVLEAKVSDKKISKGKETKAEALLGIGNKITAKRWMDEKEEVERLGWERRVEWMRKKSWKKERFPLKGKKDLNFFFKKNFVW